MLLMIEKDISAECAMLVFVLEELITNIWMTMVKIKNNNILSIGTEIIYIDGKCHKVTCKWF